MSPERVTGGSGLFCEYRGRDLIGVKRAGGAGVCLEVDEQFDDLVFADPVMQRYAQLSAQR
jgi:hypothetical protein